MKYLYKKDYSFELYYRPTNIDDILKIKKDLYYVNKAENRNFAYGIFDPNLTESDFIKKINNFIICISYYKNEPIGFNYFVLLTPNFVHIGLIVINQNKGENIMKTMTVLCQNIMHKNLGNKKMYSSTITSVPKAYEMFLETTSECFPSPKMSLQRPPIQYKKLISILHTNYIKEFFPTTAQISVNEKKFILQSIKREAGFKEEFHELPRAKKLINNLFCQCWINYNNDEDIIAIGTVKISNIIKCNLYQKLLKIKGDLIEIH
jgi:hypothetical protein